MSDYTASTPSVSFVIPAHNEQLVLANCLNAIRRAANSLNCEHEIIVVNDDSTDATAEIATSLSDRVVNVQLRNIGAVRNAGARAATGDLLVFVDADTILPVATLRQILSTVRSGTVGGGANLRFDQHLDPVRQLLAYGFTIAWQDVFRLAAGCLVYVRREVFEKIGGFNEKYFAAEELFLSLAIRRRGRFRIVRHPVITSARKLRTYGFWEMLSLTIPVLLRGPACWSKQESLAFLYDAKRENQQFVAKR